MPVKQAEMSSWRRVESVGVEAGVGVRVFAINIFIRGLGVGREAESRSAKLRIRELGTELALRRSKTAALWGTL